MADVELNNFSANINLGQGNITVFDVQSNSIMLALAECSAAKEALVFGASLLDVEVLPPKISIGPFDVEFTAVATFLSNPSGKVAFDKGNYEDLVQVINVALNKATDSMRLSSGPRRGVSAFNTPDPVI